jgi:hypothetical protein
LSNNWFSTVFFKPQNGLLSELIDENGQRTPVAKIGKKTDLLKVIKESILSEESRPFLLYNGTHHIKYLDNLIVSDQHKKILQDQEIAFYFFEPLTHYLTPATEKELLSHILKINNENHEIKRIRCLELDSISEWAEKNSIKNLKVYCTDYKCWEHYQKYYSNIKLLSMDLFVSWWADRRLPNDRHKKIPNHRVIKKKFWSGAWRYDPSRHFIAAYLASQNLTLENNVSFFFKISNAEFKRRMWFGWREFEVRHPELSTKLIDGNTKLQDQVPLSIEINNPILLGENASDPEYDGGGKNIRKNQNPVDSYQESFCAIIQESRVTQPWPNISEKTLNAIENCRPFIMVGAPGTLKMLKEMGFKTFDQWWDESYDEIDNNTDRLAKICEVIDYVNSFSLKELKNMYKDMTAVLVHNENQISRITKFYNKTNKRLVKNLNK